MTLFHINLVVAAVTAIAYAGFAIGIVRADRETHTSGFISLHGMMSFLVTFPIAIPLDYFGHKLEFRSNRQMAVAIAICTVLIFSTVFGVMSAAEYVWNWSPSRVG